MEELAALFDILTVAAVADELAETLLDGRIQKIGLVDRLTLAAEVYAGGRRHALVASADNQDARLHLATRLPSLDPALITPFGLLLRKYVRGGVLVAVEQPPLERIIRLSIAKRLRPHNEASPDVEPEEDEATEDEGVADATFVHLVVEIMGRHSNLMLLTDDGLIMESAKHVSPQMSRVRPIRPRLAYTPPPPLDRPDPRRLTAGEATALLAAERAEAEIAQVLVRRLRAISPQMGREIAFRTTGSAAATIADLPPDGPAALARETRALFEPLLTSAWAPHVYRERETGAIAAYAPIPLGHLRREHDEVAHASISAAVEVALSGDDTAATVDHAQRRARLLQAIAEERDRLRGRLASLAQQEAKATEAEQLRTWGELIFAYLWQVQPGQRELTVDETHIPLDPSLSAKENALAYFERYRKAQSAAATLPQRRAETEHELAYLDQMVTMIQQARGFVEIEALTHEWESHRPQSGAGTEPKRAPGLKRPRPLLDREGNAVYVGHSGRENELVTFDLAGPEDTWLHARGVPGSHVIVRWRSPRAEEEPETIEAAAALAAFYSAARESGSVEVDVTRRKHVRKIKGAGPGMVTYRQERTIAVRPAAEEALTSILTPAAAART